MVTIYCLEVKNMAYKIYLFDFDYCEPHTCDFNHELGEQNSQRI